MGKSKSASSEGKPAKVKKEKHYTRMQAERAISSGAVPPERFLDMSDPFKKGDAKNPGNTSNHDNYHVRAKAWKKMGSPIPDGWNEEDVLKFYASIHVQRVEMETPPDHTFPTQNPA